MHASVRPARVAVLVDRADAQWQDTCLRIIEFYSRLWGGAYNIIIPTDGKSIDERFWSVLEVFDPDHVYRYGKTGDDLRLSTPDEYENILAADLQQYLHDFNPAPDEEDRQRIRTQIDQQLRNAWLVAPFDITAALQQELKIRVAPFYFQEHIVEAGALSARSGVPWPLTDITKIAPSTEHPKEIALITVPTQSLPKLWYAAVTGLLSEDAIEPFEEAGIRPRHVDFDEDTLHDLVGLSVTGSVGRHSSNLELPSIVPFRVSMLQLGLYRSLKYQHWQEPFIVVAGDTIDDFCFYYCLSRLRDRVAWVLPSITERALNSTSAQLTRWEQNFLFDLHGQEFSTRSSRELACTSVSLDDTGIDAVINQLNELGHRQFPQVTKADRIERLIRLPLVAYERDNFQRDIIVQLSEDRSIGPFVTPKPKHFDPIHPSEHHYIAQLSMAQEGIPKHSHLGQLVISDSRLLTNGARVGKEGPAYSCPNIGYFGGDIDTVLIKPYLHIPQLHKIIQAVASSQDYECRRSDKGIYSEESIAKWGSLPAIAAFLHDDTKRGLLERFLDKSASEPNKGVYLSEDKRRYLDFAAVRAQVGDEAVTLIDDLIRKQILYRGFIFQCSSCRSSSWFSVVDVTQEFKCHRCGRIQVYTHANWKMPDEPAWFYKLDELVYQGYQHGMTASLLALDYFRSTASETFSYTTDREFWKTNASKPDVEADLFCVHDGVFTAGEAKTEPNLGVSATEENAKIRKYKRLVAGLSLRELVFATLGEEWSNATVERVLKGFSDVAYVRVRFLKAADLLRRP